jgi:hypothetical protein
MNYGIADTFGSTHAKNSHRKYLQIGLYLTPNTKIKLLEEEELLKSIVTFTISSPARLSSHQEQRKVWPTNDAINNM